MQDLVSDKFYNILSQISDQDFDANHILAVFKNELSELAKSMGVVLLKARMYEPVRRSSAMNVTDIEIYNAVSDEEINEKSWEFPTGNGGRVVVFTGLGKGYEWTDRLERDYYVIGRMIYLLVGRAKTMTILQHLTFFDQLTGIPNETRLTQFMGMTIGQGRFASFCTNFLNIKNMKLINSRYTDEAGDAVMLSYAKQINDFAQIKGGIAARLGGDNFLVFLPAAKEDEFLDFMKNIVVTYTRKSGQEINIKVDSRVGYYYIKEGDGINEAMRNADVAAKLAKNAIHPDYIQFEESMKTQMIKIRQLEDNIPNAIDNEEFIVYYQPKVDISEKNEYKVTGAEALVRWMKDGEMIAPGDFIPVLEKSGLVSLVDFYVLERVCMDINGWLARGIEPVKISSNFSRRHLQDSDFADKIEEILNKYQVNPKYIEVEITESYDDEDMQALLRFEKRMHELGISLAVDDFGSGFSSLKMIKNIVADTIKLDKSIIDGIGEENADDIIVSHIIQMVNCLGKGVIAEGVETEKQAQFLRKNGCNSIQGFLFSKPCAKEDFEKYMK